MDGVSEVITDIARAQMERCATTAPFFIRVYILTTPPGAHRGTLCSGQPSQGGWAAGFARTVLDLVKVT